MITIIWNITNNCPWNCSFCVMDAGADTGRGELSFEDKVRVVENLEGVDCRVDLSGGEVMSNRDEHLPIIGMLSQAIGKERLGISCSGAFIGEWEAYHLSRLVADVEMTMDAHPESDFTHRPKGYHATAGKSARLLTDNGVSVGLQTVVTRDHLENPELLDDLYGWLAENHIAEWSLLRYFTSGRGANHADLVLSDEENRSMVDRAKMLAGGHSGPKLDVHYLMAGTEKDTGCRCVRKSVGILPNGDVTSCFWGLGDGAEISDSRFYLGNVVEQPLAEILEGQKACYWREYRGQCPLGDEGNNKWSDEGGHDGLNS